MIALITVFLGGILFGYVIQWWFTATNLKPKIETNATDRPKPVKLYCKYCGRPNSSVLEYDEYTGKPVKWGECRCLARVNRIDQ